MSPCATIEATLSDAALALSAVSQSPRLDAEALLSWALGAQRAYLFTHPEEELPDQATSRFSDAVSRRRNGEPIAYITGGKEFWSLQLQVSHDTLVPRPETETLVEQALRRIPPDKSCRVLDLGTGSGAVAIALASERPRIVIDAVDSSIAALKIAKANAHLHKLNNINFVHGNWIEPVADLTFDFVASNPPYVRDDDPALELLRYEPRSALAAGPDGLNVLRTIAKDAGKVLAENGALLLEHGADQQDAVAKVLQDNGWIQIDCFKDLAGHPRVTTARMDPSLFLDQP